jgi:hypothetical protein
LQRLTENVAGYGEVMAGASIGVGWREAGDKGEKEEKVDGMRRTRAARVVDSPGGIWVRHFRDWRATRDRSGSSVDAGRGGQMEE